MVCVSGLINNVLNGENTNGKFNLPTYRLEKSLS